MEYLGKRNVEVKLNARVINYEGNELVLSEGPVIDTKKCILGGGCKANSLQGLPSEAYGPGNRLKVDSYNRLCEYSNIFAIGDTALMSSGCLP